MHACIYVCTSLLRSPQVPLLPPLLLLLPPPLLLLLRRPISRCPALTLLLSSLPCRPAPCTSSRRVCATSTSPSACQVGPHAAGHSADFVAADEGVSIACPPLRTPTCFKRPALPKAPLRLSRRLFPLAAAPTADAGCTGLATFIVDPNFKDTLSVAHPTPRYAALLDSLPPAVVASKVRLRG